MAWDQTRADVSEMGSWINANMTHAEKMEIQRRKDEEEYDRYLVRNFIMPFWFFLALVACAIIGYAIA